MSLERAAPHEAYEGTRRQPSAIVGWTEGAVLLHGCRRFAGKRIRRLRALRVPGSSTSGFRHLLQTFLPVDAGLTRAFKEGWREHSKLCDRRLDNEGGRPDKSGGVKADRGRLSRSGAAAFLCALVLVLPAAAAEPTPDEIQQEVGLTPHLGTRIDLSLPVQDSRSARASLGQSFGDVPVLLVLAWYSCPNICSVQLRDLAKGLAALDLAPGADYRVATLSIDPDDGTAEARKTRDLMLEAFPGLAAGLGVFTAGEPGVRALAARLGYRYAYDPRKQQYAHPAVVTVLTPRGDVSQYLTGLLFPANSLRSAVIQAGEGSVGGPLQYLITHCYSYDPQTGRYTLQILTLLRYLGVGFVVLLCAGLLWLMRTEERKNP
jgi:protein SCO1/2